LPLNTVIPSEVWRAFVFPPVFGGAGRSPGDLLLAISDFSLDEWRGEQRLSFGCRLINASAKDNNGVQADSLPAFDAIVKETYASYLAVP
jgi:hypothetical protein